MDNLPELRDIHLPPEGVSFWPPAVGWWVIAVTLISAVILFYVARWLWRTSTLIYARRLLKPLRNSSRLADVVRMSEILRRICVRKYPQAVSLFGDDWIDFLNARAKSKISGTYAELLKNAPFRKKEETVEIEKANVLWHFCNDWIGDNL